MAKLNISYFAEYDYLPIENIKIKNKNDLVILRNKINNLENTG